MAAGYMIFHNQINDQEMMDDYISRVVPTLVQYNAEVLVLNTQVEPLEGKPPYPRTVVLKFESVDAAKTWYHSPEYQAIVGLRLNASEGWAVTSEGFELTGS